MKAATVVLLTCSLVALGLACCTPDQWEGVESVFGGYATWKRHGVIKEFLFVAYDATNNRSAALVDYLDGRRSSKFKVITRYDGDCNDGKLYVLDIQRNKCWTKSLKGPFRKACIPADAELVANFSLGLSDSFNVTNYVIEGRNFRASVTVEVLGDVCVPVMEQVQGRARHVDFVETVSFININGGIKNETVFDIPEQCEKSDDADLPEDLTRDHYIFAI